VTTSIAPRSRLHVYTHVQFQSSTRRLCILYPCSEAAGLQTLFPACRRSLLNGHAPPVDDLMVVPIIIPELWHESITAADSMGYIDNSWCSHADILIQVHMDFGGNNRLKSPLWRYKPAKISVDRGRHVSADICGLRKIRLTMHSSIAPPSFRLRSSRHCLQSVRRSTSPMPR
jgi:hypothetical protein